MQETGPTVYRAYPRRPEHLPICRYNCKGRSTFSSAVICCFMLDRPHHIVAMSQWSIPLRGRLAELDASNVLRNRGDVSRMGLRSCSIGFCHAGVSLSALHSTVCHSPPIFFFLAVDCDTPGCHSFSVFPTKSSFYGTFEFSAHGYGKNTKLVRSETFFTSKFTLARH